MNFFIWQKVVPKCDALEIRRENFPSNSWNKKFAAFLVFIASETVRPNRLWRRDNFRTFVLEGKPNAYFQYGRVSKGLETATFKNLIG